MKRRACVRPRARFTLQRRVAIGVLSVTVTCFAGRSKERANLDTSARRWPLADQELLADESGQSAVSLSKSSWTPIATPLRRSHREATEAKRRTWREAKLMAFSGTWHPRHRKARTFYSKRAPTPRPAPTHPSSNKARSCARAPRARPCVARRARRRRDPRRDGRVRCVRHRRRK